MPALRPERRQSSSTFALAVSPACGSSSKRNDVASLPGPSSVVQAPHEKASPLTVIAALPISGAAFR